MNSEHNKPVFYSASRGRWRLFLALSGIFICIISVAATIVLTAIIKSTNIRLPLRAQHALPSIPQPPYLPTLKHHEAKLRALIARTRRLNRPGHRAIPANTRKPQSDPIASAFYVDWDPQSFYSLRDHIQSLNVVFPEWYFIPDSGLEVETKVDERALDLMKKANVKIVPMLSNYFNQKWNGENVNRILMSPASRAKFIQSLVSALERDHLDGINLDLEELNQDKDEPLIEFIKELSAELHARGLTLSQDVIPFNEDYDLHKLSEYEDNIILMAYDQHAADSKPGPIADLRWVKETLDDAINSVRPDKLILALGAYGYDWPKHGGADDKTYQEAIAVAKESEAEIEFDPASSNLHFRYSDDSDKPREVWFQDAATTYNLTRLAKKYQVGGVALWRLGGEDPRLWSFYKDWHSISEIKPETLGLVSKSENVDFEGEGEILDVAGTPQNGTIDVHHDEQKDLISSEKYTVLPSSYVIKRSGKKDKSVVLTFDDGPDEEYTPQILDILKRENIPAAFFVLGINAEKNLDVLRRMYADGYEIGNHTFTHPNLAQVGDERAAFELNATRRLIESVTGRTTVLFRPPFNADSEPETFDEIKPVVFATSQQYLTVGESVDPRDWEAGITAETILQRIKDQVNLGSIVLLHDAGGDRSETVKALPMIIQYYKSLGYHFSTIADFSGRTKDEVMPPLKNKTDRILSRIDFSVAGLFFYVYRALFTFFEIAIALALLRFSLLIALLLKARRQKPSAVSPRSEILKTSIIVPAFNEEVTVIHTLNSLCRMDYPNYEIIVVDDGSTDRTRERIKEQFNNDPSITLIERANGGKAAALNSGIEKATGDIVLCIDADTQLSSDVLNKILPCFDDPQVGAIAGNVQVGNANSFLTRCQQIEYITSQNLEKRAFSTINGITVIPGALGAFRRSLLIELGGYYSDTVAEDCDLTIRILKKGFKVKFIPEAYAFTEAPETVKMFLKQRFRWHFGVMQNLWKHRTVLCNRKYGSLGTVTFPYQAIFHYLFPLLSPCADLVLLLSIIGGHYSNVLISYILFLILDIAGAAIGFSYEGVSYKRLPLLVVQRTAYRFLLLRVMLRSIMTALKGSLVGWGKLVRTGAVDLDRVKI